MSYFIITKFRIWWKQSSWSGIGRFRDWSRRYSINSRVSNNKLCNSQLCNESLFTFSIGFGGNSLFGAGLGGNCP